MAAANVAHHGCVVLSASDNMSCVCAFENGRAVSRELLAQCRRSAALQSAAGITWRVRHCEGERNPFDYMSRAADWGEIRPGEVWRGQAGGPRGRPERGDEVGQRARCQVAAVMEVFSGGELSRSLTASGLRTTTVFPPGSDRTARHRCEKGVLSLLSRGSVWLVQVRVPRVRWALVSKVGRSEPVGDLAALRFIARLVQEAARRGVLIVDEAPPACKVWTWPPLKRACGSARTYAVESDWCLFEVDCCRSTRFETNFAGLGALSGVCSCRAHASEAQDEVTCPERLLDAYAAVAAALAPARGWAGRDPSGVDQRRECCLESSLGERHGPLEAGRELA